MIRIGIEFDRTTIDGRTYRRVAPFVEGASGERLGAYIAAALVFAAFALVAMHLTDVPDVQPTVNIGGLLR